MKDEIFPLDCSDNLRRRLPGEVWAMGKVIEYYSDEIDRLCTKTERQPDGSIKKVFDEDG